MLTQKNNKIFLDTGCETFKGSPPSPCSFSLLPGQMDQSLICLRPQSLPGDFDVIRGLSSGSSNRRSFRFQHVNPRGRHFCPKAFLESRCITPLGLYVWNIQQPVWNYGDNLLRAHTKVKKCIEVGAVLSLIFAPNELRLSPSQK